MYAYLASLDLPEAGYTLRTASLMTQPEYHFDAARAGDYALFGIRYLVLPAGGRAPAAPPGAVIILRDTLFRAYELPGNSYFRVADTVGSIAADRADVGSRTAAYLHSPLPGRDRYLTVGYAGARAPAPTLASGTGPLARPGTVLAEQISMPNGSAAATVHLRRRAAVVLSCSFDPGWSATIDGRPAPAGMVAPALVAVTVPPGTHRIAFRYHGFGGYPELFALAVLDLLGAAALSSPVLGLRRSAADAERGEQHQGDGQRGEQPVRDDHDQREVPLGGRVVEAGLDRQRGRGRPGAVEGGGVDGGGHGNRFGRGTAGPVHGDPPGEHGHAEEHDEAEQAHGGPGQDAAVEQQVGDPQSQAGYGEGHVRQDDGKWQPAG